MANQTVSFGGEANATGDDRALALKMFSGEVLEAYNTLQVTEGKHSVHRVTSGKSHSWPEVWKAVASSHTPGNELTGQQIKHGERVITIDDLDVAPVFIADIDAAIMHYDSRAPYTRQLGQALANLNDKNVFRQMMLAARSTASNPDLDPGGTEKDGHTLVSANAGTVRADLITALYTAAQTLDEADVPDNDDRNIFVAPAQYYLLISAGSDVVNRDFGGNGSVQEADLRRIASMNVVKSNNLRQLIGTNETSTATVNTKYRGNWTNTLALVNTPAAVGTVELIGMQTQAEYQIYRQGWLLVSRKANGHGILRPEAAFELTSA
jgi:hypothetical protein